MQTLTEDIVKLKKELRADFIGIRNSISKEEKSVADALIISHFLSLDIYKNAKTLFVYSPIGSEIDVIPVAKAALADGKRVAFPACDIESFVLSFHYIRSLDELKKSIYSVYEPPLYNTCANQRQDKSTVCIVPALAYNNERFRIGYGKGYYDKFLRYFDGISVGLVYKKLISDRIIIEKTDMATDVLICEDGVISSAYE